MGKGRKAKTWGNGYVETNAPDVDYLVVITGGVTFTMTAKTPHMAIAMFQKREPELASHIESVGEQVSAMMELRGICERCGHVVLDRSDERPVAAPGGIGIHCGECGDNARMNHNRTARAECLPIG